MRVLVINAGSSSIKFRLYEMTQEVLLASGTLERIGGVGARSDYQIYGPGGDIDRRHESSAIEDHLAGVQEIFIFLQDNNLVNSTTSLYAIGHRVVHGGETFQTPTLIDDKVIKEIHNMIPLAPLHNPASLAGIEAMQQTCPQVPQVAVFDSAFFRTLPSHAYRYALPDTLYQNHQVRRYGFHGTSHQHVAQKAAHYLQQPLTALRLITLHLGSGASVAAIRDGVCIDTSMGMTPLEGLIMGTRCGDLDPAVHFYLARTLGMDFDEIEHLFNNDSGMKGLCGVSDMRDVHRLADEGNEQARLAIAMYCYRIVKYIGAYYVALGGLDALVFTGGVGENDALIRHFVCDGVGVLGIAVDEQRNHSGASETFSISEVNKKVDVLIVPANEELEIARQAVALIKNTSRG